MMFVRLVLLPALSLAGIGLATWTVHAGNLPVTPSPGLTTPPASPFSTRVSATGIVEARSRNVSLGVARAGLVTELLVDIGSDVAKDQVLLRIDDRDARARLAVREAELVSARAELERLRQLPRSEDVPPRTAAVAQRKAQLDESTQLLHLAEGIADPRAISREELARRAASVNTAQAAHREAEAQLQLVQAGAWAPDVQIAQARVAAAEAAVAAIAAELEQLVLRAPFAGRVLQVNVRRGEFAVAGAAAQPALVLGDVALLHVRADVDEMDVWRLRKDAVARAFVRGNAELSAPLQFVAIEPLMIPKRSLSGSSREQVDTRVLQVLYALDPKALPVQVGQLVDVYVEAALSSGGGK